jgi:hypothetical protein
MAVMMNDGDNDGGETAMMENLKPWFLLSPLNPNFRVSHKK